MYKKQMAVTTIPSEFSAPFDNEIGLVYTDVGPDGAKATLELQPKLCQPAGIVHGGVYCSIIESVASVSAHSWLNRDGGDANGTVVGVNNNTDFLRAVSSGSVHAASTPIHRGRRQQLWLVTITDSDDRVVARGQVRLQNLPG
ncbi:PaaI family thioesterase [[Mycobacterium] kokjensenii]|uniref:PaaI family thioesterase n=2 Tax=[Mycobacterium] kokjensenii TaxID=3064287 RepID=A0ABN9MZW5_9MYCO|nr:PaaI family thioesterase [Mycolicibacter sp. MU0083]CAJ1498060.1 PaaI family thioesterase [Mycolicibacter sp. MU0083]